MTARTRVPMGTIALIGVLLVAPLRAEFGTAFTYQGRLVKDGTPVGSMGPATCDFEIALWDDALAGSEVGTSPQSISDVDIVDGLFTLVLDFGAAWDGEARWLEITVRCDSEVVPTTLSPRQELTPAAYSIFSSAADWTGLTNVPPGFADNVDNDSGGDVTGVQAGAGLVGGGSAGEVNLGADFAAVQARVIGTCEPGRSIRVIAADGSVICESDSDSLGDITSVAAALGLSGGGASGDVAMSVDTTVIQARVGNGCAPGSSIRLIAADGSVTCETDDTSQGDITSVTAGTGLTGGGASGDVALGIDTAAIQTRVVGTCATGSAMRAIDGSGNTTCEGFWSVDGNAGTTPGTHFIGTTDNQALELHVDGARVVRLEPTSTSPNVIAGYSDNAVSPGVTGAAIGGGGYELNMNRVLADFGAIGGGAANTSAGPYATVPGGAGNTAGGDYSFAAGRRAKVRDAAQSADVDGDEGAFVWADSTDADFESTGPNQFLIRAAGGVGINTNAPIADLDVEGDMHASGTIATGNSIVLDGTAHTIASDATLTLQSVGGVGIGTAPSAALHIGGTAGVDGLMFPDGTLQTSAAVPAPPTTLDDAYDEGGPGAGRTITVDAGAVNLAGPDGLIVNGKVGIGTITPAEKLDVDGNIRSTGEINSGATITVGGSVGVDGVMFPDGTLQTTAAFPGGTITLDQAYDATGPGTGRTITADAGAVNITGPNGLTVNGNVGVGNTSPSSKLDVTGNIHSSGTITSGNSIIIDGNARRIESNGHLEMHVADGRALRLETNLTSPNVIGGINGNVVTLGATGVTIAGGGLAASINQVFDSFGVIGGGMANQAGTNDGNVTNSTGATVAGGANNIASGHRAAIGGGGFNRSTGNFSTVAGGGCDANSTCANRANGEGASVGGGHSNLAAGQYSTVVGGQGNTASGLRSSVVGGALNVAGGDHSMAGGLRAIVRDPATIGGGDVDGDQGTFVWADATAANFTSTGPNQYLIRASGGVGINRNNPANALSVTGNADFSGNVGIGTTSPSGRLEVVGASGNSSVVLPTDAISAVEMFNEPGVSATRDYEASTLSLTTSLQTVTQHSISAPASGYVLVIATAEVELISTGTEAIFGVSDNSGALPSNQDVRVSAGGLSTGHQAVTVHSVFSISAGAHDFYFLAQEVSGDCRVSDVQLTLLYIPTAYGTTSLLNGAAVAAESPGATDNSRPSVVGHAVDESSDAIELRREFATLQARLSELQSRLDRMDTASAGIK